MQHDGELGLLETDLLSRVGRGEFMHLHTAPPLLELLVSKGLVERVPILAFPVLPPRYDYRLTALGKSRLQSR